MICKDDCLRQLIDWPLIHQEFSFEVMVLS